MTKPVALLAALALLTVGYLACGFLAQRSVLFPLAGGPAKSVPSEVERIRLGSEHSAADALFLERTGGSDDPAPLIIFFHGNAELVTDWIDQFGLPRSLGFSILLVEFPGYGGSEGTPSEKSINRAALAAFDWASVDPRVDRSRIVSYGRSLGGGAATRLAVERQVAALVLESSFTSVRPFAASFFIPGFLVRDPFDSLSLLNAYTGPLLVMHGLDDSIIPIAHGRALAAQVAGAEFEEMQCGHNDCPRQWSRVYEFLLAKGVVRAGGSPGAV